MSQSQRAAIAAYHSITAGQFLRPCDERRVAAEHDKPSAGPQRAEGAKRQRATEPVEHDVHAVAGQLADPSQEVLVPIVDRDRAEPLDRGAVAS